MNWYTGGVSEFDVGADAVMVPAMSRGQLSRVAPRAISMQAGSQGYVLPRPQRQVVRPLPFPAAGALFVNAGVVVQNLTATYNDDAPANVRAVQLTRHNVGAASPGLDVLVTDIAVGSTHLFSGAGGIPVERFDPQNYQPLELPLAGLRGGMQVVVALAISAAPAQNETVRITGHCDLVVAG